MDLEGALALGMSRPRPSLPHLKQVPGGFLSLFDEGLEPCKEVTKRWYLGSSCWAFSSFACFSQLLKIFKAKFKRSC